MPLNKKYGMKKKKYVKKKTSTTALVKRMMNKVQEKKYNDFVIDVNPDTSGIILDLTNILQGDSDFTRDGDQLNLLQWRLTSHIINADNTNAVRMIVFRWNVSTSYRVPVVSDILSFAGYPLACIPDADYVFDNKRAKQFSVLYDTILGLGNAGPNIICKMKKSYVNGLPINYEASGGVGTGKLFMLLVSDSNVVAHPRVTGVFRTIYTDS